MRVQKFAFGWLTVVLVFSAALAITACHSNRVEGAYVSSTGQMAVEFKGDKAVVTMGGVATDSSPFDVDGDKITIHAGGMAGDLVLTRNSDGSLQGPIGILRKKDS
jgi:hypothetical protein